MVLTRGGWKGYCMLLIGVDQKEGLDKGPTKKEYVQAVGGIAARKFENSTA